MNIWKINGTRIHRDGSELHNENFYEKECDIRCWDIFPKKENKSHDIILRMKSLPYTYKINIPWCKDVFIETIDFKVEDDYCTTKGKFTIRIPGTKEFFANDHFLRRFQPKNYPFCVVQYIHSISYDYKHENDEEEEEFEIDRDLEGTFWEYTREFFFSTKKEAEDFIKNMKKSKVHIEIEENSEEFKITEYSVKYTLKEVY